MSHTPGPWEHYELEDGSCQIQSTDHATCLAPIADVHLAEAGFMESDGEGGSREYAHYSVSAAECRANALLIAAAPELLLACRCALADLEGVMPDFETSGDRRHPAWHTILELRAVIAKATGEAVQE